MQSYVVKKKPLENAMLPVNDRTSSYNNVDVNKLTRLHTAVWMGKSRSVFKYLSDAENLKKIDKPDYYKR